MSNRNRPLLVTTSISAVDRSLDKVIGKSQYLEAFNFKMEFTSRLILFTAVVLCGVYSAAGQDRHPTIDEVIKSASNDSKPFNYFWNPREHLVITEYDIVVPQTQWLMMNSPDHRQKRTAARTYGRWTDNTVHYYIDSAFSSNERRTIRDSISTWQSETCLTFWEHSSLNVPAGATTMIHFVRENGCWSYVGMQRGAQKVSIGPGCGYKSIVLHEIGHALGLHHEQNRPDRDNYVHIHYQNIKDGNRHNFNKMTNYLDFGLNYDYYSIMHYGPRAFSNNGGFTITTTSYKMLDVIGEATNLSPLDILTIRKKYEC